MITLHSAPELSLLKSPAEKRRAALERSIDALVRGDARLGRRVRATVAALLAGASWEGGTLNRDGGPVELAFTSGDPTLRTTVEVGLGALPADRLGIVSAALASLGWAPDGLAAYAQAQVGATLTWGAWVGTRHGPAGADRLKLYVELPATRGALPGAPDVPEGLGRLIAASEECGTGRREYYFRCARLGLAPADLCALLGLAGAQGRASELLEAMARPRRAAGRHDGWASSSTHGFSLAYGPGGCPPALSVFAFANSIIGADDLVARVLLDLHGDDLAGYARVAASLRGPRPGPQHHNIIGWVVAPGGPVRTHITLSPPL